MTGPQKPKAIILLHLGGMSAEGIARRLGVGRKVARAAIREGARMAEVVRREAHASGDLEPDECYPDRRGVP
jgi:hypothetical protein